MSAASVGGAVNASVRVPTDETERPVGEMREAFTAADLRGGGRDGPPTRSATVVRGHGAVAQARLTNREAERGNALQPGARLSAGAYQVAPVGLRRPYPDAPPQHRPL